MSSFTPDRPPVAPALAWARRLWMGRRASALRPGAGAGRDPLLACGQRLRTAREARSLSLRQLALETRISTAVLEALEKGWRDRLPEPTYLRPMLLLLEQHLELESGSLGSLLPPVSSPRPGVRGGGRHQSVSIGSIDLFGTWPGALIYAVLCLVLLYGLNRQQQRLAARGLLTLRPIPALPVTSSREEERSDRRRAAAALLQAHPDLRPLERNGLAQALARLRREVSDRSSARGQSRPQHSRPTAAAAQPPAGAPPSSDQPPADPRP